MFSRSIINQQHHLKELFINCLIDIISLYSQNNWNLSKFVSIEIALSLCYFIDDDIDISSLFTMFLEFSTKNHNYQTLLLLTQFEEFLHDHLSIKKDKKD